jgi:Fic family protein
MSEKDDRYSKPLDAELIKDEEEKAHTEARNALRQFDAVIEGVEYWTQPDRPFRLRPSTILRLHRIALERISAYAGNFRPAGIAITGSKHQPPGAHLVPGLMEEMCDYVNQNLQKSATHLAAYILWRLNWIHPFTDGNGRTARAVSYLVLCVRLGYRLPGTNTIPAQIASDKTPYYNALEAADNAYSKGSVNVFELEELLSGLLATQLVSVYRAAKEDVKTQN